ncbi:MAG TPA: cupredoxin family copper-binding protein [Burkholderiales bacterium]|nr:cupredoxin family copper-binding protein [Burkholderiales bacterium]
MNISSRQLADSLSRKRRTLAFLAAVAAAAPGLVAAAPAKTVQVAIEKFAFAPKEITVASGTTIVWTNKDDTPHTVTSVDKSFASKGMDTGDVFQHTFDVEGDFSYLCTVHPHMTGTVHVRK